MNAIAPLFFESSIVRIELDASGQPWFNASDVCTALEMGNPYQAIKSHVDGDDLQKMEVIDSIGRKQRANFINESGLYALILGSTKEVAKRFKRWVTSEVLPAIRKTGSYTAPGQTAPAFEIPQTLPEALRLAADLADQKNRAEARVLHLEQRVEQQAEAEESLERIATSTGAMCVTSAAKVLQIGPRKLFNYLHAHDWIYRRAGGGGEWLGYQSRIKQGLLMHRVCTVEQGDGERRSYERVMVTPKGLVTLSKLLTQADRAESSHNGQLLPPGGRA